MADESINMFAILSYVAFASLLFNIFIFSAGMTIVIFNDDILYPMYQTASGLHDLPVWALNIVESVGEKFSAISRSLDKLFLLGFVSMMASCFWFSYKAKKENAFSFFSLITLGTMILFFIMNIFVRLSTYFNTIINRVLPSLTGSMPYYSFYCSHLGIINLIFFAVCIILNQTNLNFSSNDDKKNEVENLDDEH